jgi:hypothetical protein
MAAKKAVDSAEKLKQITKALKEEVQNQNWLKELADKKNTIEKQRKVAQKKLEAIKAVLEEDKALTAAAREMMQTALELQGAGSGKVKIYNPKYVTTEDKEKLLETILEDYKTENPKAKTMSFGLVKNVLLNRYNIETPSAGLFFRNQLKIYKTEGGNKNKSILLK